VPELQERDAVPPALEDAMVRSYDAEVSVNVPPVEDESVTITLVAFTVRPSATEPVEIVSVAVGEFRVTWLLFV
jgi:hypothetical protein